jgi:carbon monoxide dehydrogenase subunit G
MEKITKSISIDAPVEQVFEYINVPTNLPEIWPSMVEAKDVEKLPNGGNHFKWVYKMAGMKLEGTSKDTDYSPNQHVISKTEGGIDSTTTWKTEPEGTGTKVTFIAEYSVPVPLLGKMAEKFIVKMNQKEAETLLANLKARMERT